MAFGIDTSPIAIDSYDTALCVIPLAEQCSEIDKLRSLYDKGYGKWPPHINLVYPFVDPASLPQAKDRIRSKLAELTSATTFHVRLNQAGSFPHRTNHNIHLRQQKSEPDGLESLRSLALGSLGQPSTSYNFHLTIGQSEDETEPKRDFLTSKAGLVPHFDFNISQLVILIRERKPGQGPSSSRMRLWSTIELLGSSSTANKTPLSEFWLTTKKHEEESSDNDEEDALSRRTTFPTLSNGEVRPSATYMFNSVLEKWLPYDSELQNDIDLTDVVVSSYNILVDSENPSGHDRYPLLLSAILSEAALANILVLQEVSDDFLSYLLADANLRLRYPFTSHGPPSQPDVGPMPSLRNVVVLSCWSFSCEMLSLLRKHKAAVIATFPVAINTGSYPSVPLVVAGVHLTSGLTDGAVAAKKTQLQLLKSHLNGRYAQNSWIIAGDFNMTTSRHTVNTAVNNRLISKETQKTLQSMEVMFSNIGLLDTWAIARVEAVDCTPRRNSDDLFEGEDGATFDPSKNVLAAATSGTSNNRPQRYDRILVRPRGTLQITQFDQFGFPELQEGVEVVPSDHWGIRASMRMDTTVIDNSTSDQHVLVSHLAEARLASGSIADVSDITASLDAHGMFLTDQEMENRKEAFTLVKEVVLGSADDRVTIASDIPMVMVPVGSYALGVWTAASDIDCLCIGSISSKTFFRLSRQRINRAEERGVRLLRKVNAASGTMFELSVNGVHMDLQYCPAARVVERWHEMPGLHRSDPVFNLSMLSLRKLKPYRDVAYIQRTLPSLATFRLAHRCIKLWAVQRGIYSSKFGYLGGIHITLMLSWIYKQLAHDGVSVSAADLLTSFFHHYARFDWQHEMVFDPFFHNTKLRYQRSAREPMVVLGLHAPNTNVAYTVTKPSVKTLVNEFQIADELLSQEGMTWTEFFGNTVDSSSANEVNAGTATFLAAHDSYVQVNIQYWGRTLSKGKGLVGWVESRCLLLVVDLSRALPTLDIRIWPARYTDKNATDTAESDYQGCYLIGLSNGTSYMERDEKRAAKETLEKVLAGFVRKLHGDEKYFDPSTSWVDATLAKPNEVQNLRLDDRQWGDYVPDLEPDSDDEEDIEDLPSEDETPMTTRKHFLRPSPTSTPVSSNKLRPASDILSRLRWDPSLDPGDYIVGYEDRFLGAKEISLEKWKMETTDDEFIPQHRILYFKRRGDRVVVWERRTRVDLVFGSGVSSGSAAAGNL